MLDTLPMSSPLSLKQRVKQSLQSRPALWNTYWRVKQELRRLLMLRYFAYDIANSYRAMFWRSANTRLPSLSAELLFQYHKLEKGLVMPGKKRLFGLDPARATIKLMRRWREVGHRPDDLVFLGALTTLRSYHARVTQHQLDPRGVILPELDSFLATCAHEAALAPTPQALQHPLVTELSPAAAFRSLAEARRSVRDFLPQPVPQALLDEAVKLAQLSPSACNRQPCRVYVVSDEEGKKRLLSLQNGNAGFGHLAPHVAVVTADEAYFFDVSERHEPYIDGGLFSMSLILALRSLGVASCCLNWCVAPANDKAAHGVLGLPASQRIVMLMVIGYAPDDCAVPLSPRRALDDTLIVRP